MEINEIIQMPQVLKNLHESSFRCYHVLETVLEMVNREDSKASILELAEYLKYAKSEEQIKSETINPK